MTIAEPAPPMSVTPAVFRRHLSRTRPGYTVDVSIGGTDFKVLVNVGDDQKLADVHIAHSKHGTFGHGMLEAFGEMLTEALHYGMPLEDFVVRFRGTRFEPSGWTDDPEVRTASSVVDYLAHRLALDFLPRERCLALGVLTADAA